MFKQAKRFIKPLLNFAMIQLYRLRFYRVVTDVSSQPDGI